MDAKPAGAYTTRDRLVRLGLCVVALAFWKLRLFDPPAQLQTPFEQGGADMFHYVYPMAHAAARWLHGGEFPLWNPHQHAGHPFLAAVLPGLLYPPNALLWLLPTEVAIEALIVLHLAAAAIFTFCYARTLGLGALASCAAALLFMGSGTVAVDATWFPPALGADVWLPLGLLAIEWIFRGRPRLGAVLLALAVAMPIFAGWLQTWTYEIYAFGLYAALRLLVLARRDAAAAVRRAVPLAAGLLLGVALASAQLLPTMELRSEGPRRAGGLSREQLFGVGVADAHKLLVEAFDPTPGEPRRTYLGMVAPLLIGLSLFARRSRVQVAGLWLLFAGSLGFAFSTYTPLFDWLRLLPMLSWFRQPERIVHLAAFSGAVLAGVGLERLARAAADRERGPRLALPALATLLALVLAFRAPIAAGGGTRLALGTVGLWLAAWLPGRWPRAVALVGVVALLAGDVMLAARTEMRRPIHALEVYSRQAEVFEYLREHQGLQRSFVNFTWAWRWPGLTSKQGTLQGIYSISDYEPLSLDRIAKLYGLLDGTLGRPGQPFNGFLFVEHDAPYFRLLDLLSLRFMVLPASERKTRAHLRELGWRPVLARENDEFLVFENPRPLPRAYVVHAVRSASSEADAFAQIRDPAFDFRREAVIELARGAAPLDAAGAPDEAAPARIVAFSPRRVEIEAETAAAGYLVLTDTFYPGWRAEIDGAPAPILRANYVFRAVRVEPGRHRVTFRYAPASVRLGFALSGVALLALLLLTSRGVASRARNWWAAWGSNPGPTG